MRGKKRDEKDISKNTLLVLLVLTLLVSIVSTWAIVSQPDSVYETIDSAAVQSEDAITQDVADSSEENTYIAPQESEDSGEVSVDILDNGETTQDTETTQ